MKSSHARWVRPLLGLIVTAFFVGVLWRQVDLSAVVAALARISASSLLLALACLAIDYALRVARWWWMLRSFDPHMPMSACAWPYLVSVSLNNLLPFRAGDAARVFGFQRKLHSPTMRLLGTLVIERLLDLMTLLAFFFVGLLGVHKGAMPTMFVRAAMWIVAAGIVALLTILLFSERIASLASWVAERRYCAQHGWSEQIKRHSSHFFEALALLRAPGSVLTLLALSMCVWGFEGAVFATTGRALGIRTAVGPWFALATGTLGTLLPSSPGYVGTFDYLTMLGLVAYGAPSDLAAAFALTVHVVLWLPLTLLGMTYFALPSARALRRHVSVTASANGELR